MLRTTSLLLFAALGAAVSAAPGIRKVEDVVIYSDARFHNAFPSIVRRPDGELLVAFRRAPDRRRLGDEYYSHTDPNSYLMLVRSTDGACTWTIEPELLFAHPFGGSQDPCMVPLSDGSILCSTYARSWMLPTALPKLPAPNTVHSLWVRYPEARFGLVGGIGWMVECTMGWVTLGALSRKCPGACPGEIYGGKFVFLGGFLLKSRDGGRPWDAPILPANCPTDPRVDIFGQRLPAYNRGAMCEGSNGRLYWPVAASAADIIARTEVHLLISTDKGATWTYSCPIARDSKGAFNETSMYETPRGDLVAFLRTAGLNDRLCVARSKDRGRTFQKWEEIGFQGHPFHAMRLPDGRALLVYGYRHKPYGIRARVLDAECADIASAPEVILRDDGGGVDLGYPWTAMIAKDRALVTYYFNRADGPRTIEGTIVQVQ